MADIVRISVDEGAEVAVTSVFRRDLGSAFKKFFGIELKGGTKYYSLFPNLSTYFNLLNPLLLGVACGKAIKKFKPDIICIGEYSYKVLSKSGAKLIRYTFEPLLLDQVSTKKTVKLSLVERIYGRYITAISKIAFSDKVKFDRVIYISTWAKKLTGAMKPYDQIIYPPVNINKFKAKNKEDIITCLGLFSPKKRYELFLKGISECKKDFRVAICGSLPGNRKSYFHSLEKMVEDLGLGEKVKLYPNIPFEKLVEIISSSKICLSHIEYFGIAVVEEMAAGVVPIVYRDGALWDDVVLKGKYGFGFSTEKELSEIIDKIISNQKLWSKWSRIARERAKYFSREKFACEIIKLFESV